MVRRWRGGGYNFGRFVVAPSSGATIFRNVGNCNIPEDLNVHQHRCENMQCDDISHTVAQSWWIDALAIEGFLLHVVWRDHLEGVGCGPFQDS